ncbi:LOW QUALITY PROTEIN: uncharacterized protein EMH_0019530 [Eimeria mitis]|uniref:Uncharacterized protein n=1 Tax=Eimeria mitis TaxID=44415 RepID=U6KBS4_9EIME|nr:LOW QUALITY PROTEIN: uncharacterized protein EMH_0019530 [Eimeria mitis]CDJ34266.1 hypothetical protein EMH_0019530 [Eimeria mitis]
MFNAVYQILQGSARGEGTGLASRLRGFLQTVGLGSTGVALRCLDGSGSSNACKRKAFLGGADIHPTPWKIKATLICIKGKLQRKAVLWETLLRRSSTTIRACKWLLRSRTCVWRLGELSCMPAKLRKVRLKLAVGSSHERRNEDGEGSDSGLKGCIISKGRSVVAGANTVEATANDVEYQVKTEMFVLLRDRRLAQPTT